MSGRATLHGELLRRMQELAEPEERLYRLFTHAAPVWSTMLAEERAQGTDVSGLVALVVDDEGGGAAQVSLVPKHLALESLERVAPRLRPYIEQAAQPVGVAVLQLRGGRILTRMQALAASPVQPMGQA
jgi:hypothetical protein